MPEPLDAWFKREVLCHEEALLRYLKRVWPRHKHHEIDDLRQEIFTRVYEAALDSRPHSVRSFVFTTAHHLILDRIRRERVVSIEATGDAEELNVLTDEVSPERQVGARQELKLLARAFDLLPPRCREIFWMRRVLEIPQREVAKRLGVQEKAIEKQVAKATRLIVAYLASDMPANKSASGDSIEVSEGHERG